jgi:pyruvate/2-oxoglutarate dehydrogenase complex dihydrolipoamide acyltransferase (E2) component
MSTNSEENADGQGTVAEREYRDYATSSLAETGEDPDVLIDVPLVKVDKIYLKLADLEAHVALNAQVLDLVQLDVGVDVHLGEVEIDIEGVEAQALLKVRLDHVGAIVDRVLTTIDRNPELVQSLGAAIEDIGAGAGDLVGETGEAVEQVGRGAGQALPDIGRGAGEAVGQLGQGAGKAVSDVGKGVSQAAGGASGAEGSTAPPQAKEAAKIVAKEIGTVATEEAKEIGSAARREAKDLGRAATRKATAKALELSERRLRKRADRHNATEAAMRLASELDVDLDEIEGSGAEGRITVRDVKQAAAEQ